MAELMGVVKPLFSCFEPLLARVGIVCQVTSLQLGFRMKFSCVFLCSIGFRQFVLAHIFHSLPTATPDPSLHNCSKENNTKQPILEIEHQSFYWGWNDFWSFYEKRVLNHAKRLKSGWKRMMSAFTGRSLFFNRAIDCRDMGKLQRIYIYSR